MIVHEGKLHVHYRQFYVLSSEDGDYSQDSTAGQRNGLCGAKTAGVLLLTTVTHTGVVGLSVELIDAAPKLDEDADDIVEVSFRPETEEIAVLPWGEGPLAQFQLPVRWYRVRYSLFNVQAAIAADDDVDRDYDVVTDRYRLQFWPEASPREDEVIRASGPWTQYWHDHAQGITRDAKTPPSPSAEQLWADLFVSASPAARDRVLRWVTDDVAHRLRHTDPQSAAVLLASLPPDSTSLARLMAARDRRAADAAKEERGPGSMAWREHALLELVVVIHWLTAEVDEATLRGAAELLSSMLGTVSYGFADDWTLVLDRLTTLTQGDG